MNSSKKKDDRTVSVNTSIQKRRSRTWRRIVSIALCVGMLSTNVGIAAAAEPTDPVLPQMEDSQYVENVSLGTDASADAATQETEQTEPTKEPEPDLVTEPETKQEAEETYTLHLTHYFRFTIDGKKVSVKETEEIQLTEADFEDGECDLNQFAYDKEQLKVTEAKPISIDNAIGNDIGARIVYAVNSGWRVVRAEQASEEGVSLRTVFNGGLDGKYEFVPVNVVNLKIKYKYSNTGGLAGIDVADPDIVEAVPAENGGNYVVEWELPETPDGFRIVLNPAPLNAYLVNPPTGNETPDELAKKLENGDFSVDIDKNEVYYYQQMQDPNETENPTYHNRYSTDYNKAWNAARSLEVTGNNGYTAEAYCGAHDTEPAEGHGANALTDPKLRVTLTEDQLKAAMEDGLDITVYYRRNATWYTVNHWVPKTLSGLTDQEIADNGYETSEGGNGEIYVRLDQEPLQGRVGATTAAKAKTEGDVYEKISPIGFSQKLIENTDTVVDIYYAAADSYRVIFDTDYTYIPRQQVDMNDEVKFTGLPTPQRTGYTFGGWQYLKKGATPDANGNYADDQYVKLGKDNPQLTVNEDLISKAKLQESGGVLALHLYPIWTPNTTNVRVILWTEDLAGDDVQATATGGNSNYYEDKYKKYKDAPVTHKPELDTSNADHYSNAGSFTVSVATDASLKNGDDLLPGIQAEVTNQFKDKMGQASGINVADFYTQAGFQIVHEGEGATAADYNATTASSDGKTTINVFFTRNIYELLFTYYGTANGSDYAVATNTNGYSWGGINKPGEVFPGGKLNFAYVGAGTDGTKKNNTWVNTVATSPQGMPVPQTITIKAKYGADLRDVWPVARTEEAVGNHRMISWATTQGKYCEDGQFGAASGSSHDGEPTIMGVYAAMGSEIIANPKNNGTPHHLVAYWWEDGQQSHYRYNHCYEVPDLNVTGMQKVSIHGDDTTNAKNFLYLVPTNNATIQEYGFTDLMKVSYQGGQITYNDPNGTYYAVREYNGSYYAVARQVETVSTNAINKQNPSARLHMTRVNQNADHSTQYGDGEGGNPYIGNAGNPYDLYFYYDRNLYTITYMVPSNNITTGTEVTLGTIELPYGTLVTQDKYGFKLGYTDKNTNQKYSWTPADETPVCPDRAENGTAEWKFKGWALGPAGVNMQWKMANEGTQAQAGDAFALASNLRLYAIWDTPTYNVTFHLDGGSVGNNTGDIVENVPANRRYSSTENVIPRPLQNGFVFTGWYNADENGNITDPKTAFDFDKEVTRNLHVAAKWVAASNETFSYNVYYVTDKPLEADKNKDTVKIDANGNIVTTGGTTYYVLGKDVKTNQMYVDNMALNLTAAKKDGYVPRDKNQILTPDAPNEDYDVIFKYDPIITDSHTVQFVLAGTENGTTKDVVKAFAVEADQTVVTPKSEFATALKNMGYALVNKDADADTYTTVDKAEELKWIDKDGNAQEMATLTGGANIPDTITYLVQPIPYTITYKVADNAPTGAEAALDAVTATAGTSVDKAGDKNPTQYTTRDEFTAKNPARVYADDKWYVFSHWSLKDGTIAKDNETTFNTLEVEKGTVGNLVFVANWKESNGTGSLTVSKTVAGNAGETNKDFNFTVTLDDKTISGTFGDMTFDKGEATFTLKHGESKTASNLPEGIGYEVTEANTDGYTTTATDDKGTIAKDGTATAAFTNTKGSTGGGGSSSGSKNKKPSKVDKVLNTADHFQYVQGYPDDTVGPERNITRAEATVIFFRLLNDSVRTEYLDATNEFPDVKLNDWFNLGISTMENGGFVSGYDDGLFRPNGYITRAELATIISNFDDLEPATENKFADVDGHWAERYINSSAEKGWLSGYEDGLFRPNQYITRAETMSMINRVLDRKVDAEGLHKDAKQWIDNPEYKWYYYTVLEATNHHEYEREDASDFENWTEIKPDKIWEN